MIISFTYGTTTYCTNKIWIKCMQILIHEMFADSLILKHTVWLICKKFNLVKQRSMNGFTWNIDILHFTKEIVSIELICFIDD